MSEGTLIHPMLTNLNIVSPIKNTYLFSIAMSKGNKFALCVSCQGPCMPGKKSSHNITGLHQFDEILKEVFVLNRKSQIWKKIMKVTDIGQN